MGCQKKLWSCRKKTPKSQHALITTCVNIPLLLVLTTINKESLLKADLKISKLSPHLFEDFLLRNPYWKGVVNDYIYTSDIDESNGYYII